MKNIFNHGVRNADSSHPHHHHHHHQLLLRELVFSSQESEAPDPGVCKAGSGDLGALRPCPPTPPVTLFTGLRATHHRFPEQSGQGRQEQSHRGSYWHILLGFPPSIPQTGDILHCHSLVSLIYLFNKYLLSAYAL